MSDVADRRRLTAAFADRVTAANPESLRRALEPVPAELAGLAARRPSGGVSRLTDHDIRLTLGPGSGTAAHRVPFAWSASTARRGLGLAAVRGLVAGRVRSPAEGVAQAIAQASLGVDVDQRPVSTMDHWLAGLPESGRAAVTAEAVTWATRLWSAVDWDALEEPPLIGRDHWWDCPGGAPLALRSRAEVRVGSAHLVVLGGLRRPTIGSELSVVALVEALYAGTAMAPVHVIGWWPDSGHMVQVALDQSVLERGVAVVARALSAGSKRAAA